MTKAYLREEQKKWEPKAFRSTTPHSVCCCSILRSRSACARAAAMVVHNTRHIYAPAICTEGGGRQWRRRLTTLACARSGLSRPLLRLSLPRARSFSPALSQRDDDGEEEPLPITRLPRQITQRVRARAYRPKDVFHTSINNPYRRVRERSIDQSTCVCLTWK